MKSILKEFYNIDIDEYKEYNDGILFFIGGENYYLYNVLSEDIYLVEKLSTYLNNTYKIKLHSFIKNKNNELLSNNYILMHLNVLITDIDFYDIDIFNNCNMNGFRDDYISVIEVWQSKLDYFGEKIREKEYESIRYLYDYFSGISEMLLKFIGDIDVYSMDLVLSHKKRYNNTVDYYNPFNLTVDVINKDLVDYFEKENKLNELLVSFSNDYGKCKYLFFKLVFPYCFFNNLEECINDVNFDNILNINIYDYESKFDRYQELFNYYLLPIKKSN